MIPIMIEDPFDLLPSGTVQPFSAVAGTLLFRTGQIETSVFRVDQGRIALVRVTEEGHRVTIAQAGPGDTLAEASVFAGRFHCDAVALADTTGVRVRGQAVRSALSTDPAFAESLVQRLAFQVREERQRAEIMSIRSARERTFAALVSFGQNGTVTAFAARIGLTQEACSRALAALLAEGRIVRTGRGRYACK